MLDLSPNAADQRKKAQVHWQSGKLSIGTNTDGRPVILDMPPERGGNGWGFKGGELLLLAVGGCFTTVLLEACERRRIAIDDLHVEVSAEDAHNPFRYVNFEIHVLVQCSAAEEELRKLMQIAERGCQVSNTLRGEAGVALTLERRSASVTPESPKTV